MPRTDRTVLDSKLVSFLVLPENRFAFEAVAAIDDPVAEDARRRPIYLYGPSGVGKTHLVRHAMREFQARRPTGRIGHFTAAQFAAEFAEASAHKTISLFQAATREYDLFVLEDLQALSRRKQTQLQLLLLCDELAATGCQIVWTSSAPPGEMPEFLKKLVSRMRGGISARMRLPGPASRAQLLLHFAQSRRMGLSEDAATLLGRELPVTPRELWATLSQLESIARTERLPLGSDLIRKFLKQEVTTPRPRLEDVCLAVSRQFGMTAPQLRSRSQLRGVVFPRQCAMLAARCLTGCSLQQIGRFFGGRDHSTVLYACRRLVRLLPGDPELQLQLSQIETLLGVTEGSITEGFQEGEAS